jgi:hypothetical protein
VLESVLSSRSAHLLHAGCLLVDALKLLNSNVLALCGGGGGAGVQHSTAQHKTQVRVRPAQRIREPAITPTGPYSDANLLLLTQAFQTRRIGARMQGAGHEG